MNGQGHVPIRLYLQNKLWVDSAQELADPSSRKVKQRMDTAEVFQFGTQLKDLDAKKKSPTS